MLLDHAGEFALLARREAAIIGDGHVRIQPELGSVAALADMDVERLARISLVE
jgi:hypothetical protein